MKKRKHPIFFILLITGLVFSCSKDSIDPDDLSVGKEYYPLQIGAWLEYDVFWAKLQSSGKDTLRYRLREEVTETFTSEGETFYRLERFYLYNQADGWELDSVWTARSTPHQAIKRENNKDFVKFTFPVKNGKKWDGNVLNTSNQDEYTMEKLRFPFQAYDTTPAFDNTLTVIQGDFVSLVDVDKRREVYAKDIGLVYKESETFIIDVQGDPPVQGDSIGRHYIQTLVDYGPK